MVKYTICVDTSYYGNSGERAESVVGVAFEIIDETNGRDKVIISDVTGDTVCLYGATEAELYGIHVALERFFDEIGDVSPLVITVVCDSDNAINALETERKRFDVCADALSLVESVYSVSWENVDREKMWELDTMATRKQRQIRN